MRKYLAENCTIYVRMLRGMDKERYHLMLVNDFPPILGGQSSYLEHLCKAFPSEQLTVLAPSCAGDTAFDIGVPFCVARRSYLFSAWFLTKPLKILGVFFWSWVLIVQRRPSLLHCAHVLSTGLTGLFFKKVLGLDYLVCTHSADILEYKDSFLIRRIQNMVLGSAKYVLANSRFTARALEALGVMKDKIIIVHPRIDPGAFRPTEGESALLGKYGLTDKRYIFSLNRLVARKGNDTVIRALPVILRQVPDVCYVIFGNGPEERRLRALAASMTLEEKVVFISGTGDEKKALLQGCSVFAMVSRDIPEKGDYEGFGVVYLEAGACGKAVIAGDSGGVRDAVKDNVTGLLVDPLNVEAVADTAIRLLKDPDWAAKLGEAGRQRVEKDFNSNLPVKELAGIWHD